MADIQAAMDAIAQNVRDETGVPGLALCLRKGADRWFSACGRLRADTRTPIARQARFEVSCLMKFFLSVTALKLQATGAMDLGTDVADHLPELGASRHIRLLHLMSHSSGYHGVDITDMAVRWNSRWESFVTGFHDRAQLFAPGAVFNYEHSEHVILGEVLGRLFHLAPSALAHEILLAPAGVRLRDRAGDDQAVSPHVFSPQRGGYVPTKLPPFGPFWEASLPALTITLDDAATAVAAALADGKIARQLLTPAIGLPEMASSELRAEQPPRQFTAACGLYHFGMPGHGGVLGHNGSMFGQTVGFRADPLSGAVAVAGVNAYSAHARDTALRRALELVTDAGEHCPAIRDTAPLRHSREQIFGDLGPAELPGRYIGSYLGEVTVECDGPHLLVIAGPAGNRQSRFRIAADGDGYMIQSRMPVALRFQRQTHGGAVLFLGVHAYKSQQSAPETAATFDNEARHGIGF
jgi:CubicO group peptidase (beta-lactamase class C family)